MSIEVQGDERSESILPTGKEKNPGAAEDAGRNRLTAHGKLRVMTLRSSRDKTKLALACILRFNILRHVAALRFSATLLSTSLRLYLIFYPTRSVLLILLGRFLSHVVRLLHTVFTHFRFDSE